MSEADRALCGVTARWLSACGRCAGALGLGAGLVSAFALLGPAVPGIAAAAVFCLALLLALPERWFALRLAFDAGLFADLAGATESRAALGMLDFALQALRLRRTTLPPRSLGERVAGARLLSQRHLVLVAVQLAVLTIALVLHLGGSAT